MIVLLGKLASTLYNSAYKSLTELTEGETLAEKTGKVHCTFTALCDNLKRTCIDYHLVVRTTTADLSESDADG